MKLSHTQSRHLIYFCFLATLYSMAHSKQAFAGEYYTCDPDTVTISTFDKKSFQWKTKVEEPPLGARTTLWPTNVTHVEMKNREASWWVGEAYLAFEYAFRRQISMSTTCARWDDSYYSIRLACGGHPVIGNSSHSIQIRNDLTYHEVQESSRNRRVLVAVGKCSVK